jgi:hypothetical protein
MMAIYAWKQFCTICKSNLLQINQPRLRQRQNQELMLYESICYTHLFQFTFQLNILIASNKISHTPLTHSCSSCKILYEDINVVNLWKFQWTRQCSYRLLQISLGKWIESVLIYDRQPTTYNSITNKQQIYTCFGNHGRNTKNLSEQPKGSKEMMIILISRYLILQVGICGPELAVGNTLNMTLRVS